MLVWSFGCRRRRRQLPRHSAPDQTIEEGQLGMTWWRANSWMRVGRGGKYETDTILTVSSDYIRSSMSKMHVKRYGEKKVSPQKLLSGLAF
jgi:hypothetical protein